MHILLRLVLALLLMAAPTAWARAGDYVDSSALDELFGQLAHAQTAAEAEEMSQEIWSVWLHPDIPELDRRMSDASRLIQIGDYPQALLRLSAIIKDYPDYAEGWNQRATLYYLLNDYSDSLKDIAQTLSLEPRHFGALSGRAMIYLREGRRDDARRDIAAALRLHPFLDERRLFPELAPPVTYI